VALLVFLLRTRFRRAAVALLLGWAVLNLVVGGVLSVLPLPVLPFAPEQTLRHYSFHALYAATQVPLIIQTCRELRRADT
jgi:hypothetical protein